MHLLLLPMFFGAICITQAHDLQEKVILTLNENGKFVVHKPYESIDRFDGFQIVAQSTFLNSSVENGWYKLEIESNEANNNSIQAYAAGYLEGHSTKKLIGYHWQNTLDGYCVKFSKYCKKLYSFLSVNLKWMLSNIKENPESKYWQQVELILLQVQGLDDAYHEKEMVDLSIRLDPFGFLLFQLSGDLEDLESALGKGDHFVNHPVGSGSCSAFIKLLDDNKDLYTAHDTWSGFHTMLRIMKKYTFHFHSFDTHTETFSGSPGSIFSGDDFYILSSKLVAMETTNGNSNPDLWKFVQPDTNMEWIRNILANRMATNGDEWCQVFSKFNSGTYNNQWMIVDYNKFQKGAAEVQQGLLYILEQLPGMIKYSDETSILIKQRYWSSYNTPFFPSIFNASGLPAMVKKYGDWFTHENNPRAKIFRRDHSNVTDMPSLIKLMRYNDFKHDPLSRCNCTPPYSAENTIAARSDLNDPNGKYPFGALEMRNHGATDVKATSSSLVPLFGILAELGPTHDSQPPFKWSTSPYANVSHIGHPDEFNFDPVLFSWP